MSLIGMWLGAEGEEHVAVGMVATVELPGRRFFGLEHVCCDRASEYSVRMQCVVIAS